MGCRLACIRESMFWHSDEWVRGVWRIGALDRKERSSVWLSEYQCGTK